MYQGRMSLIQDREPIQNHFRVPLPAALGEQMDMSWNLKKKICGDLMFHRTPNKSKHSQETPDGNTHPALQHETGR